MCQINLRQTRAHYLSYTLLCLSCISISVSHLLLGVQFSARNNINFCLILITPPPIPTSPSTLRWGALDVYAVSWVPKTVFVTSYTHPNPNVFLRLVTKWQSCLRVKASSFRCPCGFGFDIDRDQVRPKTLNTHFNPTNQCPCLHIKIPGKTLLKYSYFSPRNNYT